MLVVSALRSLSFMVVVDLDKELFYLVVVAVVITFSLSTMSLVDSDPAFDPNDPRGVFLSS